MVYYYNTRNPEILLPADNYYWPFSHDTQIGGAYSGSKNPQKRSQMRFMAAFGRDNPSISSPKTFRILQAELSRDSERHVYNINYVLHFYKTYFTKSNMA
jgi:hypothetical protein